MYHVIGCGGGGSYLVPLLCKMVPPPQIVLWDGDTLEKRNLDRQLFSPDDIGKNKAEALAARHGATARPQFFSSAAHTFNAVDWIFSCVDNHAGRREILSACDRDVCRAILCGNEYEDAEAMYYQPEWAGTNADPRVVYPDIRTSTAGDPLAPEGCTGEAQTAAPQLALANNIAITLGLQLWYLWAMKPPTDQATAAEYPIRHRASVFAVRTTKRGAA